MYYSALLSAQMLSIERLDGFHFQQIPQNRTSNLPDTEKFTRFFHVNIIVEEAVK